MLKTNRTEAIAEFMGWYGSVVFAYFFSSPCGGGVG
jgi:hypothetical protein